MPLYDYRCERGHRYEKRESFGAPAEQPCDRCGATARRLINAPAIAFKGSGWYKTDSRGKDPRRSRAGAAAESSSNGDGGERSSGASGDAASGTSNGDGGSADSKASTNGKNGKNAAAAKSGKNATNGKARKSGKAGKGGKAAAD